LQTIDPASLGAMFIFPRPLLPVVVALGLLLLLVLLSIMSGG
jgi:hypothetical protein